MNPDRRDFLEQLTVGAAVAAGLAATPFRSAAPGALALTPSQGPAWDLSWVNRVSGKYRAVFDCTDIENGDGLFRTFLWKGQYGDVLGAKPDEMSAVLVIRHDAIALVMNQEFWDKYKIGEEKKVKHPFTDAPTTKNPILLAGGDMLPGMPTMNVTAFLAAGGIALACNLAFGDCVGRIEKTEKVSSEEARKRAVAMLSPGVVLQPSGVFAVLRAQDAGCHYIKGS